MISAAVSHTRMQGWIMRRNWSKLWLTLSLLLATGCGARTALDVEPDQSASPVGGGVTAQGGGAGGRTAGFGGSPGAGGMGGFTSRGTGGAIAFGGTVPFGGTGRFGGSGGTASFGGTVVDGRGGASTSRGTGGAVPFGGSIGGTVPSGGTIVGGRTGTPATGGTVPFGGSTGGATTVGGRGGTAGSGAVGGTGAAGSGGTGGTACQGLDPLHEELIDDMNDGDRFIPQVNGRAGAWKDSDDGTPGSTMFPNPAGPFTMTDTGDACRKYAAYVYGGPFVDTGATFGFGIGGPYNASAYTGISFWAKIDGGTSSGLRVAFPDKDTQPDGGLCQPGVAGPTQCWDHYGKRITNLTTFWSKYFVDFSSLSQDAWGRQGTAFDPSTIYEVQFQIPVDAKFGIWIDDVAFFTGYFGPTP